MLQVGERRAFVQRGDGAIDGEGEGSGPGRRRIPEVLAGAALEGKAFGPEEPEKLSNLGAQPMLVELPGKELPPEAPQSLEGGQGNPPGAPRCQGGAEMPRIPLDDQAGGGPV